MSRPTYMVRRGRREECDDLMRLIVGLADHEKITNPTTTKEIILEDAFSDHPHLIFYVGEFLSGGGDERDRKLVGFASVEKNSHSICYGRSSYLSGLFIEEEHRGKGLGSAIMRAVAKDCLAWGHVSLNWDVLRGNVKTRRFYSALGVTNNTETKNWEFWQFRAEDMKALISRTESETACIVFEAEDKRE